MSKNLSISTEIYRKALENSWNNVLEIKDAFPEEICNWLLLKKEELGVPSAYLAYPLISSISYCLGASSTKVSESYLEPIVMYTLVSGRSGTNKSSCISYFRNIIMSLPAMKKAKSKVNKPHCPIFDSGTMEGLMATLQDNNECAVTTADEFSSFLDSIDKINGNFDKSRFLSLYSGIPWSKTTKNSGFIEIKEPRFQMIAFNQNWFLINMMVNTNHADGFLPRFLVATPKEEYVKLVDKLKAQNMISEIHFDMRQMFFDIHGVFFEKGFDFPLDEGALEVFTDFHDNFALKTRMEDSFEECKSLFISKSIGQVLRVAAVQCAMRIAIYGIKEEIVTTTTSQMIVDDDFTETSSNMNNHDVTDSAVPDTYKNILISRIDMSRAVILVKYSLSCIFSIIDSTSGVDFSEGRGRKRRTEMPCANVIDEDFIIQHKIKIQKIFNAGKDNKDIPLSLITRNHMVPQIGGKSNALDVRRFLKGLEFNGLGELIENSQGSLFRFKDKENVSENVQSLMVKIGIH